MVPSKVQLNCSIAVLIIVVYALRHKKRVRHLTFFRFFQKSGGMAELKKLSSCSAPPLATEVASLIKKVTLALRSHIGEVQSSMQTSTVDTSTLNFGCDFGLKKQIHGTAG